ncbi:MAG: hypothetical protein IBJ18_13145 [Phycisphaerales bacterium]|nr:hypothetical protein [Phycisphaerales bacterium]
MIAVMRSVCLCLCWFFFYISGVFGLSMLNEGGGVDVMQATLLLITTFGGVVLTREFIIKLVGRVRVDIDGEHIRITTFPRFIRADRRFVIASVLGVKRQTLYAKYGHVIVWSVVTDRQWRLPGELTSAQARWIARVICEVAGVECSAIDDQESPH